jgi:hypothetical protein
MFEIYFDYKDGNGWTLVDNNNFDKRSVELEDQVHNRLKPTISRLSFNAYTDSNLINNLLQAPDDVQIKVLKDSLPYFYGFVRNTFDISMRGKTKEFLKIECIDYGYIMKKFISSSILIEDQTVSDIIEALLTQLGLSVFPATQITNIVSVFTVDASRSVSYEKVMSDLLFEYGYTYYFDKEGNFQLWNFAETTITPTALLNDTNIYKGYKISKREEKYDSVEVTFPTIETLSNISVFKDTTGGNGYYSMFVSVEPGEYYPLGASSSTPVFSKFKIEGNDLLSVSNPRLKKTTNPDISVINETYYPQKADVRFHNTGTTQQNITHYEIFGDAKVKTGDNVVRYDDGTPERTLKIKTNYISTSSDADKLANYLYSYFNYADFQYYIESFTEYDVGEYVSIQYTKLSQDVVGRIYKRQHSLLTEGKYKYYIEGVSEYSDQLSTPVLEISKPAPTPGVVTTDNKEQITTIIADSFGDVELTGTEDEPTITPTTPTLTASPSLNTVNLKADWQVNLTDFSHYEVQVSDDGSDWYALDNDPLTANYRGSVENESTSFAYPEFSHLYIPAIEVDGVHIGRTLHYRVRRKTINGVNSSWSNPVIVDTRVLDEIQANTITSNHIQSDTIDSRHIKADAISADQIEANTITADKLSATDTFTLKIQAVEGTVGGWSITADTLESNTGTNARISLNKSDNRVEVWGSSGTFPKNAMGYLGGLDDPSKRGDVGFNPLNPLYQLDTDVFGFWSAEGNSIEFKGDATLSSGAWQLSEDASIDIETETGATVVRYGTVNGVVGFHGFNGDAWDGAVFVDAAGSVQARGSNFKVFTGSTTPVDGTEVVEFGATANYIKNNTTFYGDVKTSKNRIILDVDSDPYISLMNTTGTQVALLRGYQVDTIQLQLLNGGIETQGYGRTGSISHENSSYLHYRTDSSGGHYFNKPIYVDTGAISSYNEDLTLRRADVEKVRLTTTDIRTVNSNLYVGNTNSGTNKFMIGRHASGENETLQMWVEDTYAVIRHYEDTSIEGGNYGGFRFVLGGDNVDDVNAIIVDHRTAENRAVTTINGKVTIQDDSAAQATLKVIKNKDIAGGLAMMVAGDGEADDILTEWRSNPGAANVDTSDQPNSTDAVAKIYGDGDMWLKKDINIDGTMRARSKPVPTVSLSSTAPSSPQTGDLWIQT